MPAFTIRRATVADTAVIAHHRAQMFIDMGSLPEAQRDAMVRATSHYLATALPEGEYVGWLAVAEDDASVVAGAGLQHRRILPRAVHTTTGIEVADGREAIVINVYTEPGWRRRGVARALMQQLIEDVRHMPVQRLVLHASDEGRPLYEALGFEATNEMRFAGALGPRP
jgi:ribosomal protein S18 acetylase RimI-like enzyme